MAIVPSIREFRDWEQDPVSRWWFERLAQIKHDFESAAAYNPMSQTGTFAAAAERQGAKNAIAAIEALVDEVRNKTDDE